MGFCRGDSGVYVAGAFQSRVAGWIWFAGTDGGDWSGGSGVALFVAAFAARCGAFDAVVLLPGERFFDAGRDDVEDAGGVGAVARGRGVVVRGDESDGDADGSAAIAGLAGVA